MYEVDLTTSLATSADQAWLLISTPSGWDRWFTTGAAFQPRAGARYTTADGDTGTIISAERPTIRFTWEHPKHPPGSEVTISLAGSPVSARLHHQAIPSRELADELRKAWTFVLGRLSAAAGTASPKS